MTQKFLLSAQETYKDFTAVTCTKIEELDCFFREIIHTPTGARIIHIENEDPENLFCLSFKTLPHNSRGAPHILEHVVLCGSKKFPVKDPFFSMTRRSLHTFMNALTGSDFTCYPAASQVERDFYNLLEVYLDAVFYPELKKESFLQEGCRLEFEEGGDPTTPLQFKGIVYNEMKGSLASVDTRMWHAVLEALFPDLSYAYNSGGDPKDIPDLSYEELLEFHKTYYHPSRCLFFFYGNLPIKNHLDYIEEKILQNTLPLSPLPPIPRQKRRTAPYTKTIPYPSVEGSPDEQKTIVSFGWLTCPLTEQEEVLALSVLDAILADTDASPLKAALLESGLCSQADAFIDAEMSEVPYMVVCRGCNAESVDALEEILKKTLTLLSKSPLPLHLIEAAIHQLELSHMEISGDHAPFGLTLFFRSVLAKQHGCDPLKNLQLQTIFASLLDKVQDPAYLPGLIDKYFVSNPHFVKILLTPDPDLGTKESQLEEKRLLEKKESLSKEETKALLRQADLLQTLQDSAAEQNIDCLPKVSLQDVPILTRDFPLRKKNTSSLEIFHHHCFTNHLVYADILFDLPHITDEEIPYLHLLLSLVPELGTKSRTYKEHLEYMQAHTGGVGVGSSLYLQVQDRHTMKPAISIRGKSLARKADKLLPLMQEIATAHDLTDKKRIHDLIKQLRTGLQNKIAKNALRYAIQLSLSGYSFATHFNQGCFGLRYYHFIADIAKQMQQAPHAVLSQLSALSEKVFTFHQPLLILSCDEQLQRDLDKEDYFSLSFPQKVFHPWQQDFVKTAVPSQGRIIPTQVAYNVKAMETISYLHPLAPALTVAAQLLDNKFLHTEIREKGGAYGAGASYSSALGVFYFHSHRDPHITSTLAAFDASLEYIASGKFSEQDLEEAKLGIIQQFDTPVAPGSRAILAYGWLRDGKDKALRQQFRTALLQVDRDLVIRAIQTELLPKIGEAISVTFAGKSLLEKEGKNFPVFPL